MCKKTLHGELFKLSRTLKEQALLLGELAKVTKVLSEVKAYGD